MSPSDWRALGLDPNHMLAYRKREHEHYCPAVCAIIEPGGKCHIALSRDLCPIPRAVLGDFTRVQHRCYTPSFFI